MRLNPNASDVLIDASALKAGIYFAQKQTQTGINTIKLIKE